MVSLIVSLTIFLMLGMIVFQVLYVFSYQGFVATADKKNNLQTTIPYTPTAAVVLCLKGVDESLEDCLAGLISQNYPDFQLRIIIHSPTDPASEAVNDFFSILKFKPTIEYLQPFDNQCSLKCAAIVQAVQSLPSEIKVVAFVDADTVVDEHWLANLVSPLSDLKVGATTGNRWYDPNKPNLGSLVRQVWNAAAVVQMQRYSIAWGGSLAMRTDVIKQCQLVSRWQRAFCEDTLLTSALKKHKLTLHRVPNLIVENRESISLWQAFSWISRQLLTVRLHHKAWPMVFMHGIATAIGSIFAPALLAYLFCVGAGSDAGMLLKVIVLYQVCNVFLLRRISQTNRIAIDRRDRHNPSAVPTKAHWTRSLLAIMLTQILQPFALWQANSIETVKWRGAKYSVKNGRKVKLLRLPKGDQLAQCAGKTAQSSSKGTPKQTDSSSAEKLGRMGPTDR
jgi:cellulose synthase/poly-beta-1,6-N-acetylglucosamine synthase-like glycosyltransferase